MRRVVSIWFPRWATDRLQRRLTPSLPDGTAAGGAAPLVTAIHDGRRRVIGAVNREAEAQSLRPGMAVAQALSIVPQLLVLEAEPESDMEALRRLAEWCQRTTPLVAIDGADSLWLDVTGCAHLFREESGLLDSLVKRFARDGVEARAAVADTPGAAHALARYAPEAVSSAAPGLQGEAIASFSVAALRVPLEMASSLRRLGFERISHLSRIPRALLARRFGVLPGLRLDQAYGVVKEPLIPLPPKPLLEHRLVFLEPLSTVESLESAIEQLVAPVCAGMEERGLGARQVDLLFERVDRQVMAVRVGTVRPSRDAIHLCRMLKERLGSVDPGLGVEAMHLVVSLAEALRWEQQAGAGAIQDVARLVDRLGNRLGAEKIYRAAPFESAIPERAVQRKPADGVLPYANMLDSALAGPVRGEAAVQSSVLRVVSEGSADAGCGEGTGSLSGRASHLRLVPPLATGIATVFDEESRREEADPPLQPWKQAWAFRRTRSQGAGAALTWPRRFNAPIRLLNPPHSIETLAALPHDPPVAVTWRHHRHRVRWADGPERVHGEWWRGETLTTSVRDYFQVEIENGQRFWLFREQRDVDDTSIHQEWFLHGLY